jgi:hypothetical protein
MEKAVRAKLDAIGREAKLSLEQIKETIRLVDQDEKSTDAIPGLTADEAREVRAFNAKSKEKVQNLRNPLAQPDGRVAASGKPIRAEYLRAREGKVPRSFPRFAGLARAKVEGVSRTVARGLLVVGMAGTFLAIVTNARGEQLQDLSQAMQEVRRTRKLTRELRFRIYADMKLLFPEGGLLTDAAVNWALDQLEDDLKNGRRGEVID